MKNTFTFTSAMALSLGVLLSGCSKESDLAKPNQAKHEAISTQSATADPGMALYDVAQVGNGAYKLNQDKIWLIGNNLTGLADLEKTGLDTDAFNSNKNQFYLDENGVSTGIPLPNALEMSLTKYVLSGPGNQSITWKANVVKLGFRAPATEVTHYDTWIDVSKTPNIVWTTQCITDTKGGVTLVVMSKAK